MPKIKDQIDWNVNPNLFTRALTQYLLLTYTIVFHKNPSKQVATMQKSILIISPQSASNAWKLFGKKKVNEQIEKNVIGWQALNK